MCYATISCKLKLEYLRELEGVTLSSTFLFETEIFYLQFKEQNSCLEIYVSKKFLSSYIWGLFVSDC